MRSFPSPRNDARRTRIRRSRAHRAARPGRGRGGIAASDALRWDDAGRGRRRISGVPWGFLSGRLLLLTGLTRRLRAGTGQGNRGEAAGGAWLPCRAGGRAIARNICAAGSEARPGEPGVLSEFTRQGRSAKRNPPLRPEAAMYLKPSDATASLQLPSQRKRDLVEHFETRVDELDRWREFNVAYHEDDRRFMQFLIPPGKRVLELGCGQGDLLAALKPSYGVGVDFGAATIAKANVRHPDLYFVLGDVEDPATLSGIEGPFDYIVIADTIGMFEDIDGTLRLVHHLCAPSTRIVSSYCSHLWEPVLKLAEALRLRSRQPKTNYIATADLLNLMDLADFEVIRAEQR